jgi:hypothetical protein
MTTTVSTRDFPISDGLPMVRRRIIFDLSQAPSMPIIPLQLAERPSPGLSDQIFGSETGFEFTLPMLV